MPKSVLLLQMMDLLHERPGLSIGQLAAELGRSERTVYRYLEALSEELHIPVYCEGGGYHIAERSVESRLDLSPKEVLAVRLALTSGTLSRNGPFGEHAVTAWKKIESALTSDTVESVRSAVKHYSVHTPSISESNLRSDVVRCLSDAVTHSRRVSIIYCSQRSGETKSLLIDPYALVFRRHNWYLIAYSHSHDRNIQLKLIRVIKATWTGEMFQLPRDFSVDSFYAKSWEMWTGGEERLVRVRFSPKVAQIIRESKRHPTQVLEDTPDGGVIMSVRVSGTEEIGFWILGWGPDAEVLDPPELRAGIEEAASNMLALYAGAVVADTEFSGVSDVMEDYHLEQLS
jgi:predicted DNA-binding transcriptional regulator YafY